MSFVVIGWVSAGHIHKHVIVVPHLNERCSSLDAVCSLKKSFEFSNLIPVQVQTTKNKER